MRVPRDKACPAVVVRSNLLTEMTHATILPITSELQPNISLRIAISRQLLKAACGPRHGSWWTGPRRSSCPPIGAVIGRLNATLMRNITRQLAIVLGIGADLE